MNVLLIIALIILSPVIVCAQSSNWDNMIWDQDEWYLEGMGNITGRIITSFAGHDNLCVIGAEVSLEGTNYAATTDNNGEFSIFNVPAGKYVMHATAPFLCLLSEEITVQEGQTVELHDLPPMVVPEFKAGDANIDGKIGLEDVIQCLQIICGLRSQ